MAIAREYSLNLYSNDQMTPVLKKLNHELLIATKRTGYFTKNLNRLAKVPYGRIQHGLNNMANSIRGMGKGKLNTIAASMKTMETATNSHAKALAKTSRLQHLHLNGMLRGSRQVATSLTDIQGPLASLAFTFGTTLIGPIKLASDYEQATLQLTRALDLTDKDLNKLKLSFMQMKGVEFGKMMEIATLTAKTGVSDVKELITISKAFADTANAVEMSVENIQKPLISIMYANREAFNTEAIKKYGDIITQIDNEVEKVKADDLANVWQRLAKYYEKLKFTAEEQASISAVLIQRGINPSLAATEFRTFSDRFGQIYKKTGIDLHKIITGHSKGSLEGLKQAITLLNEKYDSYELHDILGARGKKILLSINEQTGGFKALDDALKEAKKSKGAVDRELKKYLHTFLTNFNFFIKGVKNIFATIGEPMINLLKPVFNFLGEGTNAIIEFLHEYPNLKKAISYIIFGFGSLISLGIALGVVVVTVTGAFGYLTISAGILKTAIEGIGAAMIWASNTFGKKTAFGILLSILITVVGYLATIEYKSGAVSKWFKNLWESMAGGFLRARNELHDLLAMIGILDERLGAKKEIEKVLTVKEKEIKASKSFAGLDRVSRARMLLEKSRTEVVKKVVEEKKAIDKCAEEAKKSEEKAKKKNVEIKDAKTDTIALKKELKIKTEKQNKEMMEDNKKIKKYLGQLVQSSNEIQFNTYKAGMKFENLDDMILRDPKLFGEHLRSQEL